MGEFIALDVVAKPSHGSAGGSGAEANARQSSSASAGITPRSSALSSDQPACLNSEPVHTNEAKEAQMRQCTRTKQTERERDSAHDVKRGKARRADAARQILREARCEKKDTFFKSIRTRNLPASTSTWKQLQSSDSTTQPSCV